MTYKRYKLILLCFLLIFALLVVGSRFIIKGSELPTLILLYTVDLLYWLALFFFLLHSRKKGITKTNSRIAPAKLLPILVAWLALISILYSFTMTVIYKTVNAMVYRTISEEEMLARTQRAANDITKTSEQRLKAAQYYFKYSGQGVIYRDKYDKNIKYIPDDSARQARLQYLETIKQQNDLYRFIVVSGVLSLLSGLTVVMIYFSTGRYYRKETFT
jgi:hypothetical protein